MQEDDWLRVFDTPVILTRPLWIRFSALAVGIFRVDCMSGSPWTAEGNVQVSRLRFCDRVFTYGQNSLRRERTAFTKSPFPAMKHCNQYNLQFVQGYTMKGHNEICEGSSTGSQQVMTSAPSAASTGTVSARRLRSREVEELQNKQLSALNTEDPSTPATKESKLDIEDEAGSEGDHEDNTDDYYYDDSDSVEDDDDDDDSLDVPTHFTNEFPSTSDAKKAEDAENSDDMFTDDPNELVDRLRYLPELQKRHSRSMGLGRGYLHLIWFLRWLTAPRWLTGYTRRVKLKGPESLLLWPKVTWVADPGYSLREKWEIYGLPARDVMSLQASAVRGQPQPATYNGCGAAASLNSGATHFCCKENESESEKKVSFAKKGNPSAFKDQQLITARICSHSWHGFSCRQFKDSAPPNCLPSSLVYEPMPAQGRANGSTCYRVYRNGPGNEYHQTKHSYWLHGFTAMEGLEGAQLSYVCPYFISARLFLIVDGNGVCHASASVIRIHVLSLPITTYTSSSHLVVGFPGTTAYHAHLMATTNHSTTALRQPTEVGPGPDCCIPAAFRFSEESPSGETMRVKRGECVAALECMDRGNRRYPTKTRRPAASSGTILTTPASNLARASQELIPFKHSYFLILALNSHEHEVVSAVRQLQNSGNQAFSFLGVFNLIIDGNFRQLVTISRVCVPGDSNARVRKKVHTHGQLYFEKIILEIQEQKSDLNLQENFSETVNHCTDPSYDAKCCIRAVVLIGASNGLKQYYTFPVGVRCQEVVFAQADSRATLTEDGPRCNLTGSHVQLGDSSACETAPRRRGLHGHFAMRWVSCRGASSWSRGTPSLPPPTLKPAHSCDSGLGRRFCAHIPSHAVDESPSISDPASSPHASNSSLSHVRAGKQRADTCVQVSRDCAGRVGGFPRPIRVVRASLEDGGLVEQMRHCHCTGWVYCVCHFLGITRRACRRRIHHTTYIRASTGGKKIKPHSKGSRLPGAFKAERSAVPIRTTQPRTSSAPSPLSAGLSTSAQCSRQPCIYLRDSQRVIEVSMEQRRNERAGETGDPRENLPTNDIVPHDAHLRESGMSRPEIQPGLPWWEASRLTAQPPRSPQTGGNHTGGGEENVQKATAYPVEGTRLVTEELERVACCCLRIRYRFIASRSRDRRTSTSDSARGANLSMWRSDTKRADAETRLGFQTEVDGAGTALETRLNATPAPPQDSQRRKVQINPFTEYLNQEHKRPALKKKKAWPCITLSVVDADSIRVYTYVFHHRPHNGGGYGQGHGLRAQTDETRLELDFCRTEVDTFLSECGQQCVVSSCAHLAVAEKWDGTQWELCVQDQEVKERYGRHLHALLEPHRYYAQSRGGGALGQHVKGTCALEVEFQSMFLRGQPDYPHSNIDSSDLRQGP
ncbi:hypothetical protein PR048_019061 [Dryococelus australis]|uniref:Uncharacterized protein n=1 Tax=Dryococelus australis TaxID=614101 RepID=A0ABQ9H2S1_9NEOP|nr:hypothetical protein PR048_019061 [Dryococelus australis]